MGAYKLKKHAGERILNHLGTVHPAPLSDFLSRDGSFVSWSFLLGGIFWIRNSMIYLAWGALMLPPFPLILIKGWGWVILLVLLAVLPSPPSFPDLRPIFSLFLSPTSSGSPRSPKRLKHLPRQQLWIKAKHL